MDKEPKSASNIKDANIYFPCEKATENCLVRDFGNGLYELLEHPVMSDSCKFGDTILTKVESSQQIQFIKVVQRSQYKEISYLFAKEALETEEFAKFIKTIEEKNIYWQRDFGGLFCCFPREKEVAEVQTLIALLCSGNLQKNRDRD